MLHHEELDKRRFVSQTINESIINGDNSSLLITNFATAIVQDTRLFSNSDEVRNFIQDRSESNKNELVDLFVRALKDKSNFNEFRYIDSSGMELIDITRINDDFYEKSDEELKNLKDDEFFTNLMAIGSNEIYISSLDIYSENNTIGRKFISELSIIVPLFDSDENLLGIIVIDRLANDVVKLIRDSNALRDNGLYSLFIYNMREDESYYLQNKYEFTFDTQRTNNLDGIISFVSPLIGENSSGSIQTKDSLITYYDILETFNEESIINSEKWVITHTYNLRDMFSFTHINKYLFSAYGLYLLLILIVALILANIINRLKINESELCVLNRIAETTTDAVVVTDNKKNILFVNESVENCSGYTMEDLFGKDPHFLISEFNNPNVLEKTKSEICELSSWKGVLWFKKKNGIIYPNKLHIFKMGNKSSENHYIGIFSALSNSQVRTASNQLEYKESNLVVDLLKQVIKRDEKYIILYIALDNYNLLVDLYIDSELCVLDCFVDLIASFKKEGDVIAKAGKNKVFVVLNITNIEESAYDYINELYSSLTKMIHVGDDETCCKIRIGASIYPNDTSDILTLYKNTLLALQWTRMVGANNISIYNPQMLEKVNRERQIEYNLRMAITKNELYMVYQPQVDIRTGKIIGVEALIRWKSGVLGIVPPSIFIPIAEKNRMMFDLGKWIIERTCSDLNYIFNIAGVDSSLRCAINISALQLEDNRFLETLYEIINKNNLSYNNIELEITENIFLEQSLKTTEILEDISSKGIIIAIDDFGTGYSSLSYLNRLPVDKIKIDRGFIKGYPTSDDGELAKILIQMSKTLKKEVLFEGAETLDQVAFLKDIGCEYIQGYYYSKPLERENLIEYLNKK
jgi:PAS domain S-box-containing protein